MVSGNIISNSNPFNGIALFNAQENKIEGNIITDSSACGISINGSVKNTIKANDISGSYHGILLTNGSNDNEVAKNVVGDSVEAGIQVKTSSNNKVEGNEVINCKDGIRLVFAYKNKISGNNVEDSTFRGIVTWVDSEENTILKNKVSGSFDSDLFEGDNAVNEWKKNRYETTNFD